MKSTFLKLGFLALLFPAISFAQTSTLTEAEKLEAKKKAEAEKAALPKPYNETENATAKIAELVKKAKKENKNIIRGHNLITY